MFIYQLEATREKDQILKLTKELFGVVPPHWELLAQINPKRFEMFITEIKYLLNHPHIDSDFFAFLRLYVANKEEFSYCKSFNTKLLLSKGYDKKALQAYKENVLLLPLDDRHQLLAQKVMKALYQPSDFTKKDIDELKVFSWTDAAIYDAIDHGAFLFKFSRILKAYLS